MLSDSVSTYIAFALVIGNFIGAVKNTKLGRKYIFYLYTLDSLPPAGLASFHSLLILGFCHYLPIWIDSYCARPSHLILIQCFIYSFKNVSLNTIQTAKNRIRYASHGITYVCYVWRPTARPGRGEQPKTRPLVGSRRAPADRPRVWRGLPQV